MAHAAVDRTFELKRSDLIGGKFNSCGVACIEDLIDIVAFDVYSVFTISGGDHQPHGRCAARCVDDGLAAVSGTACVALPRARAG